MAVAVFNATQLGTDLTIEICPMYANGCTCEKDGDGNPSPPHPVSTYAAATPDARDKRSAAQWQAACAKEALLLERVDTVAPAQPLVIGALIGLT